MITIISSVFDRKTNDVVDTDVPYRHATLEEAKSRIHNVMDSNAGKRYMIDASEPGFIAIGHFDADNRTMRCESFFGPAKKIK